MKTLLFGQAVYISILIHDRTRGGAEWYMDMCRELTYMGININQSFRDMIYETN